MKFLTDIFVNILKSMYTVTNSYGWSIILITILMRIIIFPLTLKQEQSMKNMKKHQPEIDRVREKYKDNKEKQNEEIMRIYRENKVNPAGGCLPLLIQMPVFIALYGAFNGNTIPNDATFWWFNLKEPDKLFEIGRFAINLFPILNMGVTYIQMKMSAASQGADDPAAKQMQSMMTVMPVMMLVLFYNMPSAVTLYYLVSGILGLVIQYFILKRRDDDQEEAEAKAVKTR